MWYYDAAMKNLTDRVEELADKARLARERL